MVIFLVGDVQPDPEPCEPVLLNLYSVPSKVTLKFSQGVPGVKKSNELLNVPEQLKSYWIPGFVLDPTPNVPSHLTPILIQLPWSTYVLAVGSGDAVGVIDGVNVSDGVSVSVGVSVIVGVFVAVKVAVFVGVAVFVDVAVRVLEEVRVRDDVRVLDGVRDGVAVKVGE